MGLQGDAARPLGSRHSGPGHIVLQPLVQASDPHKAKPHEESRSHDQRALSQRGELLYSRNHKRRRRRNQQQDHGHQTTSRRLPKPRQLQNSHPLLLRRTRSLPTIIPDGPLFHVRHCRALIAPQSVHSFQYDASVATLRLSGCIIRERMKIRSS